MSNNNFFNVLTRSIIRLFLLVLLGSTASLNAQIGFLSTDVISGLSSPTSLQFGPDGRLYLSQQNGTLYAVEIQRTAPGAYSVVSTETINLVKDEVPNHNDDGTSNTTKTRQVTGVLVLGTSNNPVLLVSSSDWRIAVGNDSNLDTNSGIVSQITWVGDSVGDPAGYWDKVDIIRGLPRSEENHATNGMDYDPIANTLYLAVGGQANKGAPSNNFSATPEFVLAAAILSIDMTAIDAMPVYVDPRTNTQFVYDIPTLDDPTRSNIDNTSPDFPYDPTHPYYNLSIDQHDPFGGNNGLNQGRLVAGGPVQVYGSGFRNPYDVVFTSQGRVYSYDNGPNSGWGGQPKIYDTNGVSKGDGPADPAAGDYASNEMNETSSGGHGDRLHFVNGAGYYAGYPNPTRADPVRSGIYTYEKVNGTWNQTGAYNWLTDFPEPPVDAALAHPIEMTYISPGDPNDPGLDEINSSTNGITEYTATNFGGAMQGNILAVSFNDNVYRYELNAAGDAYVAKEAFLSGLNDNPLDITAQGDNEIFPGTIWIALHGSGKIMCFEPNDFAPFNCTAANDPAIDEDGDGFSNADEIANGTNPCSQGSLPKDYDGDFISNLTDTDDDNDGLLDTYDPFPVDASNGMSTSLPIDYGFSINNGEAIPGSMFGLGFTGLISNGEWTTQTPGDDYLTMYTEDTLLLGGAISKFAIQGISSSNAWGSANNQEHGFQFGVDVDVNNAPFTITTEVESPYFLVNGSPITPINDMSCGLFFGNGDQDNFIQIALHASNGQGGIRVIREVGGVSTVTDYGQGVVGNILGSNGTDLYFAVDPVSLTVQPKVSIDGGAVIISLGSPLAIPAAWLDANDNMGMAVGVMATSVNSSTPFTATWDFINVRGAEPTASGMPDREVFIGEAAEAISLDPFFQDDEGVENLIYSVQSNSGTYVTAVINGSNVDLTYPALDPDEADIVIRATDLSGFFVEDTFHVSVREPLVVLYRVNAAGAAIASTDAPNPDWSADSPSAASQYRTNGENTSASTAASFDAGIPSYLPTSVFASERWDPASGGEMMWDFPATVSGIYEVNIFLNNSYGGTSQAGQRVFDISIEDSLVFDDVDPAGQYGHQTGFMLTYQVNVTDGNLDIDFQRVVENPLVNAIEILGPPVTSGPANLIASPDPLHFFSTQVGASSVPSSVTLSNSGGQALTVSAISLTGTDVAMFSHSATLPILIGAGQSTTVDVTFSPTSSGTKTADISFTHTGSNSSPLTVSIDGEAIPAGSGGSGPILYRLNNGGAQVAAADGSAPDWALDQSNVTANGGAALGTPSPYLIAGGEKAYGSGASITLDVSVPAAVPMSLFQTERWDEGSGDEMQFGFPVTAGTQVQVRLYVCELYFGGVGNRVFDVEVEGVVPAEFDNIDAVAAMGDKNIGYMISYDVLVLDGMLNLNFLHQQQNPAIKGIEIVDLNGGGSILSVTPGSYDFGQVDENTSSPAHAFVLSNSGPDTININQISLAGVAASEYSLNFGALYYIEPGASANVNVTFSPTSFGTKDATLEIGHDGYNGSPMEVSLTGVGVSVGGILGVDMDSLSYPTIVKNTVDGPQVITLTNTGNADLTVSATLTGAAAGSFTQDMTTPVVLAGGASTTVNVSFAPTTAGYKSASIAFTHDGLNTSPESVAVEGTAIDSLPPTPTYEWVYRINTAGATQAALDAPNMNWAEDVNGGGASPYRNNGSNISGASYNSVDASVPAYTPMAIFSTERWDTGSNPDMEWDFPITEAGTYEIRMYFLNSYGGTSTPGKRVFDIEVEGAIAFDDFDIVSQFGHKAAGMVTYQVTVSDGNLDINFPRVIGDPLINGIEILKANLVPAGPSISITSPTAGQVITTDSVVITWNAFNLNPADHYDIVVDGSAIGGIEVVQPGTSYTVYGLTSGSHTVSVQIEDYAHTMYPGAIDQVTFTVQLPIQTVNITSPVNGATVIEDSVILTWNYANLDALDHFHVQLDNDPHTSVLQPETSFIFNGLTEGTHTAYIHVADYTHSMYMNSEAMDSVTFTVDFPDPSVTIVSPVQGSNIGADSVTVVWNYAYLNALDHVHVQLDNDPHTSVLPPGNSLTFNNLSVGQHTIYVQVADYTHSMYMNSEAMDSVTFTITDPNAATVAYRINVAGGGIVALDGPNMDWAGDGNGGYASPFRTVGSNTSGTSFNSIDPSVPAYVPTSIFQSERWDGNGGDELEWDFPVANGTYQVNLFLMNNYGGTSQAGKRVFDIMAEGVVAIDDFDCIVDFGHKVGGMKTIIVTVTDGNLDIDFIHVIENPLLSGIEVLQLNGGGEFTSAPGEDPVNNGGVTNQGGSQGQFNTTTAVGPESAFFGYDLKQNYPNPFSDVTNLAFELPETAEVSLTLYNMLGQPVKAFNGIYAAGRHDVEWQGEGEGDRRVASGVYHLVMMTNTGFASRIKVQVVE